MNLGRFPSCVHLDLTFTFKIFFSSVWVEYKREEKLRYENRTSPVLTLSREVDSFVWYGMPSISSACSVAAGAGLHANPESINPFATMLEYVA